MKLKILFVSFVLVLVLGSLVTSPVTAKIIAQVTASPTFIPPSATSSPYPFTCPVGTPLGYGTYTPSPLWLSTCGSCGSLPTNTIIPTLTLPSVIQTSNALTASPTTTATTTPTATLTRTPTATPSGLAFTVLTVATGAAGTGIQAGSIAITWACTPTQGAQGNSVDCTGSGGLYDDRNNYGTNWSAYVTLDPINSGTFTWYWEMSGTQTSGDGGVTYKRQGSTVASTGSVALGSSTNPSFLVQFDTTAGFVGSNTGVLRIRVSTTPLDAFTPTPQPTATAIPYNSTYCSSVAPTFNEFGFDLFVPDGAVNCDMGWDEIIINEDYSIPAAQICFQPSEFGVIKLFAESYEVGVFGLAAAAAFFYRWLRTT